LKSNSLMVAHFTCQQNFSEYTAQQLIAKSDQWAVKRLYLDDDIEGNDGATLIDYLERTGQDTLNSHMYERRVQVSHAEFIPPLQYIFVLSNKSYSTYFDFWNCMPSFGSEDA
ncbi:hypothetical protein ACJX0J_017358, partial [Zea mays]